MTAWLCAFGPAGSLSDGPARSHSRCPWVSAAQLGHQHSFPHNVGPGLGPAWSAGESSQAWGGKGQAPHSESHTGQWSGAPDTVVTKTEAALPWEVRRQLSWQSTCTSPAEGMVGEGCPGPKKVGTKAVRRKKAGLLEERLDVGWRGGEGALRLERWQAALRDLIPRVVQCL